MSIADKLTTIAENEQRVFEAGMSKAESDFWDEVQANGNRTDYEYAFAKWGCEYIRPKYKVTPTERTIMMFNGNPLLKKVEAKYFDLSKVRASQTSATGGHYNTFTNCTSLEEIEDVGMPAGTYDATYRNCQKMKRIAVVRSTADTMYEKAFLYDWALEDLTIEGVIGQNGFNVGDCPLTHDSLMSIINALATKTSGTWTVTLGSTNLAKLTDAEKAIATQKGWTLA